MSDRVFVAEKDDLQPGERKIVDTDNTSIGVFNIEGEFYALENRCAHQGGPVCTGKQQGAIVGEFVQPGERVEEDFDDETPVIACPWHGYEYEVKTGIHIGTETCSIPTYDVIADEENVYIEL